MPRLIRPQPDLRERVWGGTRLGPPRRQPIGEAWIAGPASRVADGPEAGRTLEALAARDGAPFVGSAAHARTGDHFPLLAKLLDPTSWLSVQVHPDDLRARALEGPGAIGKTESWHVIEAGPEAGLLLGVRPEVDADSLRTAIRRAGGAAGAGGPGAALVAPLLVARHPAAGTSYLVPAGVLHAVGPGLLMYELQQASDLTYRCEDWGRSSTPDRGLHTEKSLASLELEVEPEEVAPLARTAEPAVRVRRITCAHFAFDLVRLVAGSSLEIATEGRSLHVLATLGRVGVRTRASGVDLAGLDALVVPANADPYVLEAADAVEVLVGFVP